MDRPVNIDHHLQLKGHNVNLSMMSYGSATMESDKFVACSLKTRISKRYSIFDLDDIEHPLELAISPDSILVNPARKEIIAARTGREIQIYKLENGQYAAIQGKAIDLTISSILLCKWIDEKTIGVITQDKVYHWSLEGDVVPITMFCVDQKILEHRRIIDYRADSDQKLFVIVGEDKSERGHALIQLFDTESGRSQIIEGNAACFARIRQGKMQSYRPFLYTHQSTARAEIRYFNTLIRAQYTVYVLGRSEIDNMFCKMLFISYTLESGPNTHITMHASAKHGLVFILTKFAHLHVFDIENSTEVYNERVMEDSICLTTDYSKGGVMGIARKGLVFSISIKEQAMLEYVSRSKPDLAQKLSQKWNIGVAPSAPLLTLGDQDEMGGRRRRRITTDDELYPLTDTIKDILRAAGQDPSKMSRKEIKFVYDFIGKYQEDWIASECDTPIYENLPLHTDDPHPSEPIHPPVPAPRPSLAKSSNQVDHTDWKARAENAEKERDDIARKYQKLLIMMGRMERK